MWQSKHMKFRPFFFASTLSLLAFVQLVGCTKDESSPAKATPALGLSAHDAATASPKPAYKPCSDHQHCAPLREFENRCRVGKNEADCKKFVEIFEKISVKTDCQRTFDKEPVPSVWLCDHDAVEVEYPKLHERSAATLSKLKFNFAKKFYGSEAFRSTLDGALAEAHRADSERGEDQTSK